MFTVWRPLLLLVTKTEEKISITEDIAVKDEGSCVTIDCTFNSMENMHLFWFKDSVWDDENKMYNGIIVHSNAKERPSFPEYSSRVEFLGDSKSGSCTLRINKLQMNDSGNYSFRYIHDKEKYMSEPMNLTVNANPCKVDLSPLEEKSFKEGELVTLQCTTSAKCSDYPEWVTLSSSETSREEKTIFPIFPNMGKVNRLRLNVTWKDHGRNLSCRPAYRLDDCQTRRITLTVEYAPKRTNITGAQKINLGFALNLRCETFANPPPDVYFWYHKSEVGQKYVFHSNTTKSEYQIEKVAVSDSGWYSCSPRNAVGTGLNSTGFQVHVLYPPRKLILDMPTTVREAENLTISCTVESYPEAIITLKRTHSYSEEVVAERSQSNTLTFFSVASRSHAGLYTCTAKNSEGKNFTEQRLKVFYAPKDVQASVSSEKHNEGSSLTLTCEAHSEPIVTQYTWKKQSRTPAETVGEGPHLTLHSLNKSDSGNYFCTASNEVGTSTSASVPIKVQYHPHIKIIHNLTSLDEWDGRSPVQLTCSADCYPSASHYKWHKKDHDYVTIMSNNQNYTVQPQDPGIYFCTAGNDIGTSTSSSIRLFVNRFVEKMLLFLIPVVFCLLIVFMFLLYRTILRKRSSDSQLFFFEGSSNNTRENLVMEGVMEPSGTTTAPPNSSTSRENVSGSLAANLQTVYDLVKLPQIKQNLHPHTEEDLDITSVNYINLPVKGCKDPTASDHSTDGAVYAVVSKNMENKKVVPSDNEDYENISGACAPKLDFTKILWESDSSEEEEVNYSKVTFTAKPQHKPPGAGGDFTSDEKNRIEYSHVKI